MTDEEADALLRDVVVDLHEYFSYLNDSDEAPFGEYPRVSSAGGRIVVAHESDDSIQIEILVQVKR